MWEDNRAQCLMHTVSFTDTAVVSNRGPSVGHHKDLVKYLPMSQKYENGSVK